MKIWLGIKIFCGLAVAGVVAFTAMLAYHVVVEPLGGIFEKIVPEAGNVVRAIPEAEFAKMLDAAEMPDFEPGDRAFQKAHELIALGQIGEAREKLTAIVNVFPGSSAAPTARRIVGQMNLDEILSSAFMEGKETYTVKRGDSYLAIAGRNQTTMDMIMYLSGMMELRNLQPGDELLIMALNFRLIIETRRNAISLWDGPRFIAEYPVLLFEGPTPAAGKTKIVSRRATIGTRNITSESLEYRAAAKSLQLERPALRIMPYDEHEEVRARGLHLRPADAEELFLLTRVGNEVEIR